MKICRSSEANGDVAELLRSFHFKDVEGELKFLFSRLLSRYRLVVNGCSCRLMEIELYYSAPGHRDPSVYRRHTGAGELFFHHYGVDISFPSDSRSYGGILIRSLRMNQEMIAGPVNCQLALLRRIHSEGGEQMLRFSLIPGGTPDPIPLYRCRREVSRLKAGAFRSRPYRYLAEYHSFPRKYRKEKFEKPRIFPEPVPG